jgi:hypothetical protein
MAFHPFQSFRKRQKTLLAILTIFVMFIFILSYGKGDAFDWLMTHLGAGRRPQDKTEVVKLYGKTVTVGELAQLRDHRHVADTFIQRAVASAAQPERKKLDPGVEERLQAIIGSSRLGGPAMLRQRLREYQEELLKDGKKESYRQVGNFNRGLGFEEWRFSHPGELYFGGSLTAEGLLDFLLWRQQADRLNITLTDDDVRKEINQEAGDEVLTGGPQDASKIALMLQGVFTKLDTKTFYDALRDEFRVRLAQDVLLGSSGGARAALGTGLAGDQVPAGSTPEQFWEFFKDKRTALTADFLKVPVKEFTGQVKEPDDLEAFQRELEDLFKRYKDVEPAPDRAAPGFKVPRKVKVEWVAADPNSAHYREASAKMATVLPVSIPLMFLTAPSTMLGTPTGAVGLCATLPVVLSKDEPLHQEYNSYIKDIRSWWDASPIAASGNNPYALGLRRPDTVAATLGQLLGTAATGAAPWPAVWSADATLNGSIMVRLDEQKAREASMILAGVNPSPLGVLTQETALANVPVPKEETVRGELLARIRDRIAPKLAEAALEAFVKEVEAKHFTPKEAAEYVAKNANLEHGITAHGATKELRDQNDIADDPELAPLRRAYEGRTPLTPKTARDFAGRFFETFGPEGRMVPITPYKPESFSTPSDTQYQFWLTQSEKPYVPTFEEARPKVEAAWKLIKARELARKEAQAIAEKVKEKVRDGGGKVPAGFYLTDQAARPGFEKFSILSTSKLEKMPPSPMMFGTDTTRYQEGKIDEAKIPYARKDTVEELFNALKQPGDVAVIKDRPDRNYYVVLLQEKKVPTESEFFTVYQKAPRGFASDSLWSRFQAEREEHYRSELVRHLRQEARAPLDDQGNYQIDPEVRRNLRSFTSEE